MARQARVDVPNTPYHVINRAVGRLRIFSQEKDYQLFIDLLTEAVEKTGMKLLAFTLMPNHWHLVLFPEKAGVAWGSGPPITPESLHNNYRLSIGGLAATSFSVV